MSFADDVARRRQANDPLGIRSMTRQAPPVEVNPIAAPGNIVVAELAPLPPTQTASAGYYDDSDARVETPGLAAKLQADITAINAEARVAAANAARRTSQLAQSAQAASNSYGTGGFSDGRDPRDIRVSFGYQSVLSRGLADASNQGAPSGGSPGAYLSVWDSAADARYAAEQKRVVNNIAAAVGGVFVAGPMFAARSAGLNEYQIEQAGVLGLAAMDAAGVKGSVAGTRLASAERSGLNRTSSLFTAAEEAAFWQGNPRFPGVDRWRDITLKQGIIVYAGEPGLSGFMTTESAIRRSGMDATSLFGGLQVPPRNGLYRNGVTAYEVVEDIPAAMARTLANNQISRGGLPQLYVPSVNRVTRNYGPTPSVEALVNDGKIRPVVAHPLTNRSAPR